MVYMLPEKSLLLTAACSRIIVLVMQVVFNIVIPDHKPDVFNPPLLYNSSSKADGAVQFLFEGFKRWDGVYFMHIAEHGYTYENTLAFFPAFPLLTRAGAYTLLLPLHGVMALSNVLLISGVLVNFVCFVAGTWYLYKLAKLLLGKGNAPWYAAVLFCFNPASIFMSSCYAESIFSLASFAVMYHVECEQFGRATVFLGLATATRSNGLVLAGYPAYAALRKVFCHTDVQHRMFNIIRCWMKTVSCILYGCLPFAVYQLMAYTLYCQRKRLEMPQPLINYARERKYHLPSDNSSDWCFQALPLSYNYIQKTHWNVGLFEYYEPKQIPNFLLASPVIFCSIRSITVFMRKILEAYRELLDFRLLLNNKVSRLLPYCIHLLFLLLFGIANVHIQILTRMVYSSSPLIYFYLAKQFAQYFILKKDSFFMKFVMMHFVGYFVLGTVLHSNFLPWT